MMPLWDNNPRHKVPWVTVALIGLCLLVFMLQMSLGAANALFIYGAGFIPARLFEGAFLPPAAQSFAVPPVMSVFSSMFLHGDIMHLLGNMLFLWVFGDNVENRLGWVKFIIFYLLCGVVAALTQGLLDISSNIPMIGASGAISGVLGAYFVLYPRVLVTTYIPYVGIAQMNAKIVLATWFGYQLIFGLADLSGSGAGVAFWAHIGGFVAGWVLIRLFVIRFRFTPKPKEPPLWH